MVKSGGDGNGGRWQVLHSFSLLACCTVGMTYTYTCIYAYTGIGTYTYCMYLLDYGRFYSSY